MALQCGLARAKCARTVPPLQSTGSSVARGYPSGPTVMSSPAPARATIARATSSSSTRLNAGTYVGVLVSR